MSENFRKNNIAQSTFEKNYNQISEPKKEILNQKYNCSICLEIIKHENPFLCYNCQKIFHNVCLKNWDERQKRLNKILSCPNCRNELPFEKWKVFRNYDEIRTKDAQILNQAEKSFNSDEYLDKTMHLFQIVLNKLKIIHPKIESEKNYKLNNLIEEFKYNLINPSIDEISTVIIEELDLIEEHVTNAKEEPEYQNIKYLTEKEGKQQIFGHKFVTNNSEKINLVINGKKSPLVQEYYLKEGENNVTLCIQNKLTNLSDMFAYCKTLNNIDELRNLNTENVIDFSGMFKGCKISNIKALENWDTSKSETFSSMFYNCKLLTNIKPLKNFNVSKCKNFSNMFDGCSISDIKSLESWDVSNGIDFNGIFANNLISDIKPLEKWDISNAKNLGALFSDCKNLSDISPIQNWNISKCENLSNLFSSCKKLKDISPLKNWDVSNVKNLSGLFRDIFLPDISPLKNWNVSNVEDFSQVFQCHIKIADIDISPLKNWNVSKGINFSSMFHGSGLNNLNPIKNWNVSNGEDFSYMFYDCSSLSNLNPIENWNVSNGKKFRNMFTKCFSIRDRNIVKKWKLPSDINIKSMFEDFYH